MEASARDVTSRSGLFGSPRSSLIARCPSHSLLAGRKRRRVLQWVLAQYRGGSTPRGRRVRMTRLPPRSTPAGATLAARWRLCGLPRPSTCPTSRTSPLTRSSERPPVIPPVPSMPAWVPRLRRQRHRGGRPEQTRSLSRPSSPIAGSGSCLRSRPPAYAAPASAPQRSGRGGRPDAPVGSRSLAAVIATGLGSRDRVRGNGIASQPGGA